MIYIMVWLYVGIVYTYSFHLRREGELPDNKLSVSIAYIVVFIFASLFILYDGYVEFIQKGWH